MPSAGTVALAIHRQRLVHTATVADEMGEAERQAEIRGDLGAVVRTAQNPHLGRGRPGGLRADFSKWMAFEQLVTRQPSEQIAYVRWELVGCSLGPGVQRIGRSPVGARCASQTQIDTPRRDSIQDTKLLRHFQRGIVRQHNAGGTNADPMRRGGDGGNQDFRRRPGLAFGIVVFRAPVPRIAQCLAMLGKGDAFTDRRIR